tara:strand:- start:105 stop:689 length:585 start_codon:yes stop_codon:yes gene_type:complete
MRPHSLKTALITENAFQLVAWSAGAKEAQSQFADSDDHDAWGPTKPHYVYNLQATISELLVVTATKIRILQDSLSELLFDPGEMAKVDAEVSRRHPSANPQNGNTNLSIREACNKIIHATSVAFVMQNANGLEEEFSYWSEDLAGFWFSGEVRLKGEKRGEEWVVLLNPAKFGVCIIAYIDELESNHEIHRAWE